MDEGKRFIVGDRSEVRYRILELRCDPGRHDDGRN